MFFANVDKVDMSTVEVMPLGGPQVGTKTNTQLKVLINEPGAMVALEQWPGGERCDWAFWHDEIHYVLGGKAEITYTLPPNHNKVRTRVCEKGDSYLIIAGTRANWKVVSEEPYLHLCIVMPRYSFDKRLLREEL